MNAFKRYIIWSMFGPLALLSQNFRSASKTAKQATQPEQLAHAAPSNTDHQPRPKDRD